MEFDEPFEIMNDEEDPAVPFSGAVEEEGLPENETVPARNEPEGLHTVLSHEKVRQKAEARKWNQAPVGGGKYALSPDGHRVRVENPARPQEPIKG